MVSTINILLLSERRIILVMWRGKKNEEKRGEQRQESGIGRDVGEKKGPLGAGRSALFTLFSCQRGEA